MTLDLAHNSIISLNQHLRKIFKGRAIKSFRNRERQVGGEEKIFLQQENINRSTCTFKRMKDGKNIDYRMSSKHIYVTLKEVYIWGGGYKLMLIR